jgi:hypothetical protein
MFNSQQLVGVSRTEATLDAKTGTEARGKSAPLCHSIVVGTELPPNADRRFGFSTPVFEGESCHDLARALFAYCVNQGSGTVQFETVNDFLTQGPIMLRRRTGEFNPRPLFAAAIELGWLEEADRRQVKVFLSSKGDLGWPVMHALDALRKELNYRARQIRELQQKAIEIPERINQLRDLVSSSASAEFSHLVTILANTQPGSVRRP